MAIETETHIWTPLLTLAQMQATNRGNLSDRLIGLDSSGVYISNGGSKQMSISGTGLRMRWLYCLLLMALLCTSIQGRVRRQDLFAAVPESLRVRLTERLKL